MSVTPMTTSNSATVKRWSKEDYLDIYKSTAFGRAFTRGTIFKADELNGSQPGDSVTFTYTGILTGIGTGEGGTLVGSEEALNINTDSMVFNVFRHAVNNPNTDTIEQQRTVVPFETRSRELLKGFHASRLDASFFNQVCGVNTTTITVDGTTYSGTNRLFVQGLNSVRAPSTNRYLIAGGQANDQSLTSSNTMTLDLIDAAVELATGPYPTLVPLENEEFDLYLHQYQFVDLMRDTSGKIQWYVNALADAKAGNNKALADMTFYSVKPVGKYRNVNILVSTRIPLGQNSSSSAAVANTRRAVLCGKNAASYASKYGGAPSDKDVPLRYFFQLQDYEYYKGVEGRMIYGIRKVQFNSAGNTEDLGSIVISTYAAAHTS
jgi:hypothetical protein